MKSRVIYNMVNSKLDIPEFEDQVYDEHYTSIFALTTTKIIWYKIDADLAHLEFSKVE